MGMRRQFGAVLVILVASVSLFRAQGAVAEDVESCASCHAGAQLSLSRSEHGERLSCTDCHPEQKDVPHPDHGASDATPPGEPRMRVSETGAACHADVAETYAASVHGRALAAGNGRDVPVCTDCHRSHGVAGPHDQTWLVRMPRTCGGCHADEERMRKYGLSTAVLRTYLADFHGMTASLSHAADDAERRVTALCSDCHGIHDITRADDPASGVRAKLAVTCRKCHAGADAGFPSAWLSHYEPSWKKAPVVYAVKLFYRVLIPFM